MTVRGSEMIFKKIIGRVKLEIWNLCHKKHIKTLKKRLVNENVTIISPNCTGGVMYHDLGLQFRSPTVNLYFEAEDYIKFCENLKYYLDIELCEFVSDDITEYPIGKLGDLTVYFVHYKTFDEAKQKWDERKKRIDFNNLLILGSDRDGMNNELISRFDKLNFAKVMFIKDVPEYDWQLQIRGCVDGNSVGNVLSPDMRTLKILLKGIRFYDQFDWVGLINQAQK